MAISDPALTSLIVAVSLTIAAQNSFLVRWVHMLPTTLQDLFSCPLCLGFHFGWLVWLLIDNGASGTCGVLVALALLHGVVAGTTALLVARVLEALAAVARYYGVKAG